jgi:bacteriorhodopsin
LILWTLYPVVWAVGDGARKLSVDQEIIGYAVLDVLAKVVFGFWLLLTHARSATAVNIEGWWSHGLNSEGALRLDDDEGA